MNAAYVQRILFPSPLADVRIAPSRSVPGAPVAPGRHDATSGPAAARGEGGAGRAAGADQAVLVACESVNRLLRQLNEQLQALEQQRSQSLEELQRVAIDLAMFATSQILQREVQANEFPIEKLVQMALERLGVHQPLVFRLHPQDLRQLQTVLARAEVTWSLPEGVRLLADPAQPRGSCFADAGEFGLLSTLEQQLEDLQRSLREGLEDAQTERRTSGAAD
jgi:flagellar biosynthesis/type III secretory pathway protein FliH